MTIRRILMALTVGLGLGCAALLADPMPEEPWTRLAEQAKAAQKQGNTNLAEKYMVESLREAEKLGPEHPAVAVCLHNLAWIYTVQGKLPDAEALLQKAVVILAKNWGPENPRVVFARVGIADLRTEQKRFADAEPLYQSAVAGLEKTAGPKSLLVGLALEHYAFFLTKADRKQEAEQAAVRSRDILDRYRPRE